MSRFDPDDEEGIVETATQAGKAARDVLDGLRDPEVETEFHRITHLFAVGPDPPTPGLATAKALRIIADSLEQTFGGEQADDADDDSA